MRIAVVGSGIAGLSAAWLLSPDHDVSLFEAADYAGGHSNTVDVTLEGITHPVDTGFLVHNSHTYPNFIRLLELLQVQTHASDMSFSVRLDGEDLEWAGSTIATLFAQRRNLFRPAFWRMLRDILRFNRSAPELLARAKAAGTSLGELLDRDGYSREFSDWYLLPMGAAIWSCPTDTLRDFPAQTFLQFCLNHGLLQIFDRPQWKTIRGGSREYVRALCRGIGHIELNSPVSAIRREPEGVRVSTPGGSALFDAVVIATHTDQAMALLKDASSAERAVLGSIGYQANTAYLHTDASLMPRRSGVWSAWNYHRDAPRDPHNPVAVTYWINKLQALPFRTDVFVTLNPTRPPRTEHVIRVLEYAHPLFDQAAYAAQAGLEAIQGRDRVYFCGAWAGYGFHEDGLKAGMRVARLLGARIPWEAS